MENQLKLSWGQDFEFLAVLTDNVKENQWKIKCCDIIAYVIVREKYRPFDKSCLYLGRTQMDAFIKKSRKIAFEGL